MEKLCHEAIMIFKAAVVSVKPESLIKKIARISPPSNLIFANRTYKLSQNVYVVGFGKAVLGMAIAVEQLLDNHLVKGIISVPKGLLQQVNENGIVGLKSNTKIKVYEGAENNLPDFEAMSTASQIVSLSSSLKESDILIVLISGGGSALFPLPHPQITLEEKLLVTKLLSGRGAPVQEINLVRICLSAVKGGSLALMAKPAQVVSLILSDIIGDPLHLIASGPTVRSCDGPDEALQILKKYNLMHDIPQSVKDLLLKKSEVPVEEDFAHVENVLLGCNENALHTAVDKAKELKYVPVVVTRKLQGNTRCIGKELVNLVQALVTKNDELLNQVLHQLKLSSEVREELLLSVTRSIEEDKFICLLFGGETTVEVTGKGSGGRNQELALAASLQFHQLGLDGDILLLSAGTDGIDGPTPAAGAIATPFIVEVGRNERLDAQSFLVNNDSFNFYRTVCKGKWHVVTGHTGTNVMDLIIILFKCKVR